MMAICPTRLMPFSLPELKQLSTQPNSCISVLHTRYHISLHPYYLYDLKKGIQEYLFQLLKKHEPSLNGIVMGYDKLQLSQQVGQLVSDQSLVHVNVLGDFYLFVPKLGATLKGVVNRISPSHVGCLVHQTFNVSLPKSDGAHAEAEQEWQGLRLAIGQEVEFEITLVDLTQTLPYLRGRLTTIGPEAEPAEDNQEVDNDDSEIPCSQELWMRKKVNNEGYDSGVHSADMANEDLENKMDDSSDGHAPEHKKKKKKRKQSAEENQPTKRRKKSHVEESEQTEKKKRDEKTSKKKKKKADVEELNFSLGNGKQVDIFSHLEPTRVSFGMKGSPKKKAASTSTETEEETDHRVKSSPKKKMAVEVNTEMKEEESEQNQMTQKGKQSRKSKNVKQEAGWESFMPMSQLRSLIDSEKNGSSKPKNKKKKTKDETQPSILKMLPAPVQEGTAIIKPDKKGTKKKKGDQSFVVEKAPVPDMVAGHVKVMEVHSDTSSDSNVNIAAVLTQTPKKLLHLSAHQKPTPIPDKTSKKKKDNIIDKGAKSKAALTTTGDQTKQKDLAADISDSDSDIPKPSFLSKSPQWKSTPIDAKKHERKHKKKKEMYDKSQPLSDPTLQEKIILESLKAIVSRMGSGASTQEDDLLGLVRNVGKQFAAPGEESPGKKTKAQSQKEPSVSSTTAATPKTDKKKKERRTLAKKPTVPGLTLGSPPLSTTTAKDEKSKKKKKEKSKLGVKSPHKKKKEKKKKGGDKSKGVSLQEMQKKLIQEATMGMKAKGR